MKRIDRPHPFQKSKFAKNLLTIGLTFLLSFIVYTFLANWNLGEMEVNGPLYQRVILNKDLIADILPPPLYIIESYTITLELVATRDPVKLKEKEAYLARLKADYLSRHELWSQAFRDNPKVMEVIQSSYVEARAFYEMTESQIIPLINEGRWDQAREIVAGPLADIYGRHRQDIDQLVRLARSEDHSMQNHAKNLILMRTWIQYGWEAVTFALIIIPIVWLLRAERKLTQVESNFQTFLSNSSDVVFSIAIEPDGDFQCLSINPAAERLGFRADDFIGKSAPRHFPPATAHYLVAQYLRCAKAQKTVFFELEVPITNGVLWFDVMLVPIKNLQEEVDQVMGVCRNITPLKSQMALMQTANSELEARVMERTKELENACRELESFSYSVSHDLRSPLRGINGFCNALIEDYGLQLDDTANAYLHRIHAASQRMGEIIDDLLQLAQVTRSPLVLKEVDLGTLAQGIIGDLQTRDPKRLVTFICSEGLSVSCDPRLILIVLENLLGNAWKYSSKHERATIEFGVRSEGDESVYFIKDDGAGFDMLYAAKLFQNFQRLHDRSEFEGTGIGLAIVARIIHRHNGRIWGQGEVEKGAVFSFTIGPIKSEL